MTLRIDCDYSADWLRVTTDNGCADLEIHSPVEDKTVSVLLENRAKVEQLRDALSLWLAADCSVAPEVPQ